jgi:hypothetical protein
MGSNHLSDEGLLKAIYGIEDAETRAHLAACAQCARQAAEAPRQAGQPGLDELPEAFWQRQRASVLGALPRARPIRARMALVAAAAILLIAVVALLLAPRGPVKPAPITAADEQLFREACETANRIVPKALAPVALLLPADSRTAPAPAAQDSGAIFRVQAGDGGVVFMVEVTDTAAAAPGQAQKGTRR